MLQLILQAVTYPFGPRLSWMTGLLAIALSLLLFGYFLTKPPGQFSDTPPRFGVVMPGACKGELAVYTTLDRNQNIVMELLQSAMADLSEREQHILQERRLTDEPKTLEELSEVYNVSRERIRQIEVRAFEKLQKAMQKMAKEQGLPTGV